MAPKKKQVQRSLEQSDLLPTLKKPLESVGKTIDIPGSHWGDQCPAADKEKIFKCTINDYTVLHDFSPRDRGPGMQLTDMGVDGQGGNSVRFWMKYPYPFLNFFYKTFPLALAAAHIPDSDQTDGAAVLDTAEEAATKTPRSVVYDYLEPLRSEKVNGSQKCVFPCKDHATT